MLLIRQIDVGVEIPILQHVVGVPLGGELQLRINAHVVRAARLVLDTVHVSYDAVVEPLVVAVRRCGYTQRDGSFDDTRCHGSSGGR
jgi:hypothetical protein